MQFHLGFSNNLCHDLTGRHSNHRQIPNHISNKQAEIETRKHQRDEGQEVGHLEVDSLELQIIHG